ncbi:MAG: hypothetical protein ACRYGG_22770 [Janthinobacterium lividum]
MITTLDTLRTLFSKKKTKEALELLENTTSAQVEETDLKIYNQSNYQKAVCSWKCLLMPRVFYANLGFSKNGLEENPVVKLSEAILEDACEENDFDYFTLTGATDGLPFSPAYALQLFLFLCYLDELDHDLLPHIRGAMLDESEGMSTAMQGMLNEPIFDNLMSALVTNENKAKTGDLGGNTRVVFSSDAVAAFTKFAERKKLKAKIAQRKKIDLEIEGSKLDDEYKEGLKAKSFKDYHSIQSAKSNATTSKAQAYNPNNVDKISRTTAFIKRVFSMRVFELLDLIFKRQDTNDFLREKIIAYRKKIVTAVGKSLAEQVALYPKYKGNAAELKTNWEKIDKRYKDLHPKNEQEDMDEEIRGEFVSVK